WGGPSQLPVQGGCPPESVGAFLPLTKAEDAAAHTDAVPGAEDARPVQQLLVDIGSRDRSLVGDDVVAALPADAGVQTVHVAVAEQTDVAALSPTDGDLGLGQDQFSSGAEAGLDLEPGLLEDHLGQPDEQP